MLATYNPSEIIAVLAGVTIQGYADGTMIKIEYNEDNVTLKVGTQGDAVRTINQNRSAKITVTLLQSSPTNALLSELVLADRPRDRNKPAGKGAGPSTVRDLNGTMLARAQNTWITKSPMAEYAKESGTREWVFETDDLDLVHAGANS
jgi:hypothetical protein